MVSHYNAQAMESGSITIKGIRDGLQVTLGDGELVDRFAALEARLRDQNAFFRGGEVTLVVGYRSMTRTNLEAAAELFSRHGMNLRAVLSQDSGTLDAAQGLKLGTRLAGSGSGLSGGQVRSDERELVGPGIGPEGQPEAVLVWGALRSGQAVSSDGHVTIIGDVNPGAEVIAGGAVVVWGRLRGVVHAGAFGDRTAVVCALELAPTQLRIAEMITVSPVEARLRKPVPEIASIRDRQIVAERWDAGLHGRR
jgi:septum site-determining protein MinC